MIAIKETMTIEVRPEPRSGGSESRLFIYLDKKTGVQSVSFTGFVSIGDYSLTEVFQAVWSAGFEAGQAWAKP